MTNDNDDDLDAESNHNFIDPNKADDSSSNASMHSTRSHTHVHNMTDEPPQQPPDEEEPDHTELPEMETKFPYYVDPKEFLYHCPTTYPVWEATPTP